MNARKWMLVASSVASLSLLGCDSGEDNDNRNTDMGTAAPGDSGVGNRDAGGLGGPLDAGDAGADVGDRDGSAAELTDGEIASVTAAANAGEVEQANAALPKLQTERAREFAQHMIEDHEAAQARQAALLLEQNIEPEPAPQAKELTEQSLAIVSDLTDATEEDIDRLYMQSQVRVHQQVLDLLTDVLIPSADADALKEDLEKTRMAVETHLTSAKEILGELE